MSVDAMPLTIACAPDAIDEGRLMQTAALVRRGGLVAFPTETVYGIAVHAWDRAAVERLHHLKGRPADKHLTLHLWDVRQVEVFAREVPPHAQRLIEAFWPGPLTLILPGRATPTVGLRLPDHPVARTFLRLCQVPVAAPSANLSGQPDATDAAHVIAALGAGLDAVIDAGPTRWRQPSTVVDTTMAPVRVLREGVITREQLRRAGVPCA